MNKIIFTDLDGTLLNQKDYDYRPAIPIIKKLQQKNIPIVPVTSKTRVEVTYLREQLCLNDPFIVENGSAVFIPQQDERFKLNNLKQVDNYYLQCFGCSYTEATIGLQKIAKALGKPLKGFDQLSELEIQKSTGLSPQEVQRAKAREFTEPFITPAEIFSALLEQAITEAGFKVVVGDRFSHLIGPQAGKGKAVQWLTKCYENTDSLITIGLGNSPNDLGMLEAVDIPIIIPGEKGPHPGLRGRGWEIASLPGSAGWAKAVAAHLSF